MAFDEEQFIRWCTAGPATVRARLGPGDDAAILGDGTVLSVDAVVQGVHFDAGDALEDVAHKALAAAVSDVCAMGAVADAVAVAVQMPAGTDGRRLAAAIVAAAERLGVEVVGGDTVSAGDGVLSLAVTATGSLEEGEAPWLRSGARVGDALAVSGPLGGARSGRHLRVCPRADVVSRLRRDKIEVHAAMDLSDGLGTDLPRLCAASRVGAEVDAESLPVHGDVPSTADPVTAVLGDGEDFELLFALPAAAVAPAGLLPIGRVVAGGEVHLVQAGAHEAWPAGGWQHAF